MRERFSNAGQIIDERTRRHEETPVRRDKRKPETWKGKAYLFPDNKVATFDISTGRIQIPKFGFEQGRDRRGRIRIPEDLPGDMTIEIAIAYALGIADSYAPGKGDETEKDRKAFGASLGLIGWWGTLPSEEERAAKEREIREFLDATFGIVREPRRKSLKKKLTSAVQLDSKGRRNPQAKGLEATVPASDANIRARKNRAIYEKYALRIFPALVLEREIERAKIGEAIAKMGNVVAYRALNTEYPKRVERLLEKLPTILSHGIIKVAPYRVVAAEILARLVKFFDPNTEKMLTRILGDELMREIQRSQSIPEYLDAYSAAPNHAKEFITNSLNWAIEKLTEALGEGERVMMEEEEKRRSKLQDQVTA